MRYFRLAVVPVFLCAAAACLENPIEHESRDPNPPPENIVVDVSMVGDACNDSAKKPVVKFVVNQEDGKILWEQQQGLCMDTSDSGSAVPSEDGYCATHLCDGWNIFSETSIIMFCGVSLSTGVVDLHDCTCVCFKK